MIMKLLNQYGTIENLKEHMDELKGKMGEKVRTNIELGLLSKKIATIITDAPVELDLSRLSTVIMPSFDARFAFSTYIRFFSITNFAV